MHRAPPPALAHGPFPFRRRGFSGSAASSSAGSPNASASRSTATPSAAARRRAAGWPGKARSPSQFGPRAQCPAGPGHGLAKVFFSSNFSSAWESLNCAGLDTRRSRARPA
jgi:hypothetical protein